MTAMKYEWMPLKCGHCEMFGHLETECRKKKNSHQEWRAMPARVQDSEQEDRQQTDGYVSPRRIARTASPTRIELTSATNAFQVLIENEIRAYP